MAQYQIHLMKSEDLTGEKKRGTGLIPENSRGF